MNNKQSGSILPACGCMWGQIFILDKQAQKECKVRLSFGYSLFE